MSLNKKVLPNGNQVCFIDEITLDYCYKEIFEEETYLKNGIEVKNGDTIFDIGANFGMFSLFMNGKFDNLQIHAFEPAAPIFEALKSNLQEAKNVVLNNVGLGASEQEVDFLYYPKNSGNSSPNQIDLDYRLEQTLKNWKQMALYIAPSYRFIPKFLRKPLMQKLGNDLFYVEKIRCKIIPLSKYIQDHHIQKIDLMKIDAENYEHEVLEGLGNENWSKIQQIVIEVHTCLQGKHYRIEDMIALLEDKGFKVTKGEDNENTLVGTYVLYGKK
jgi:FkbM family methyltransferase